MRNLIKDKNNLLAENDLISGVVCDVGVDEATKIIVYGGKGIVKTKSMKNIH